MGRLQSWYHWVFTDRALFLTENKRLRDDNKRLTDAKRQFKDIATELARLRREQRRARTVMDKMLQQQKEQRYWTRVYEGQLQAILRHLYLDSNELSYPSKLSAQRFRLVSQNEEDGMTWALLSEIGATNRRFVDIGCGLNGGNSGFLARECGWSGLMIDADQRKADRAARRYGSRVKGVAAWVTRDNINELLEKQGVDRDVDLLSIDVDGVDYWIWDALERCSPRVVIIEYNALFGSSRSVAVPYDHNFDRRALGWVDEEHADWARHFYGASLSALTKLGGRKGYRLVAAEPAGTNAYFLRNDVGSEIPACEVISAYHIGERHNSHIQRTGEDIYDFVERAGLQLLAV